MQLIEHKQPNMVRNKRPQQMVQEHIALIVEHARSCPLFTAVRLHPDSGFYLMEGPLVGVNSGRREIVFAGTQKLTRVLPSSELLEFASMAELNTWLVGGERWSQRVPPWRVA
jgi:hypothetical protein